MDLRHFLGYLTRKILIVRPFRLYSATTIWLDTQPLSQIRHEGSKLSLSPYRKG